MRKRALLLGGLFACAGLLIMAGWYGLMAPRPGVTVQNAQRLRHEMTTNEVEAIFGRPPDARLTPEGEPRHTVHIWEMGDNQRVRIFFDAHGLFGAVIVDERDPARKIGKPINTIPPESFVDKLRQRLGL